MLIALHKNARTTPAMRAEIAASSETASAFAHSYGVNQQTVCKWKNRDDFGDRSHTAHRLLRLAESTLSAGTLQRVRHAVRRQRVADATSRR